jgi:hypothetical protein
MEFYAEPGFLIRIVLRVAVVLGVPERDAHLVDTSGATWL